MPHLQSISHQHHWYNFPPPQHPSHFMEQPFYVMPQLQDISRRYHLYNFPPPPSPSGFMEQSDHEDGTVDATLLQILNQNLVEGRE